jgi:hypothetical protein
MNKEQILISATAIVVGSLYYRMMERSIPTNVNCSFAASVWTDILATIAGLVLMWRGHIGQDHIVFGIGVTIITEHVYQWWYNKGPGNTPRNF